MEVPKQKDIRNEQLELELFPEEATESPGQGQSEMTAEKEPEGKSIGERAIRKGDIALRNETMSFIVSYKTMEDAFRKVASNKGSAGVSGFHQVSKWVNNNLLRRAGYTFLYDVYQKVHTAI